METAWNLAREQGIAALSLRDLARRLGMTAPSLYSYFDSKHALFDAMFAQGYEQFLQLEWPDSDDLRDGLRRAGRTFLEFCTADPARYQLLFQRAIPGFAPSPESWELAQRAYHRSMAGLARFGVREQRDLDLVTGVFSGLAAQQLANQPGGSRWAGLVDEAADMLAEHLHARTTPSQPKNRRQR